MSFTTRFVTGKNMEVLPRVMLQNLPEGLEPKQILVSLANKKTLNDIKKLSKSRKITYNSKDEKRKVNDKLKEKQVDSSDYIKYVKKRFTLIKLNCHKLT